MIDLIYLLDLFGVMIFGITGALVAREKRMDVFGVVVIALVTALGGGTIRDLILGRTPVFWVHDVTYIWLGVLGAVIAMIATRRGWLPRRPLLISDAFGLALFAVIGADITLNTGAPALIAVMMGVTSAVAGGVVRDLLSDQIPLILREEIYATAALAGAVVYVLLDGLRVTPDLATIIAISVALTLRLAAIRYKWSLPLYVR